MTQSQSSIFARMPVITAIVVGTLSLAPHLFLPREVSLAFAAVLVGIIAGVYFGFAVVNGSNRHQLIELNVTSAFGIAANLGIDREPLVVAFELPRARRVGRSAP
jgi:hypothetical protein